MEIASGFWGRLFTGAESWAIRLTDKTISLRGIEGIETEFELTEIRGLNLVPGSVWSTIVVESPRSTIRLRAAPRARAVLFQREATKAIARAVHNGITEAGPELVKEFDLDSLYGQRRFLANRDIEVWLANALGRSRFSPFFDHSSQVRKLVHLLRHPVLADAQHRAGLSPAVRQLHDLVAGSRSELKARNSAYVAEELQRQQQFFDTIESQPLTDEQRRAAVILEDRNLVVAAAGSGKSSTVVAKIGHALSSGFCTPNEILALAFNKSAVL